MAAKKNAFVPIIPGLPPPPLPEVEPSLTPLRDALLAAEALAAEPRAAQLRAEQIERDHVDPSAARQLLELIPRDVGEVPDNPDYSAAKTAPQRRALEAAYVARIMARLARERSVAVLFAIAARDLDFQTMALATIDGFVGSSNLSGVLFAALVRGPALAPSVAEHVRRAALETPPGLFSAAAIEAAFRQGWADELLWPAIERRGTMAGHQHAKLVLEIGSSGGFFAQSPATWRPRLLSLVPLADVPYDWTKGDEGRAPLQLGVAAREGLDALDALDAAAPTSKAASKPPSKGKGKATTSAASEALATPVNRRKLRTAAGREAALDALGVWIVDHLATADDARARVVIEAAISSFYDVRQAAGQERQEYAGHFFLADGVGLDDTGRPIPWSVLGDRVGDARLDQLRDFFLEVEATVT